MIKIWEHVKVNAGWVYFGMFVGLGVWNITTDEPWYWVAFDFVAAVVFLYLYQCPKSPWHDAGSGGRIIEVEPEPDTVTVDLSKGSVEPVETPEDVSTEHDPLTCQICRRLRGEGEGR